MENTSKARYFKELAYQLKQLGFETEPLEGNLLPVKWKGERICRAVYIGGVLFDENASAEVRTVIDQVYSIASTTADYMKLIEESPVLKAQDLDDSYKLLADFNGTVLAGKVGKFGAQFVTWDWTYDHLAVCQGKYYENYAAAKSNFASRSGLVDKYRQLSDEQLAEVYRCVRETLESDSPITDERRHLLEEVSDNIERSVDELDRLVEISSQKEAESEQGQAMQ